MNTPRIQYFLKQLKYNLRQLSSSEMKIAQEYFRKKIEESIRMNPNSSPDMQESGILVYLGEPKDAARNYVEQKGIHWRDPDGPNAIQRFFYGRGSWIVFFIIIALASAYHYRNENPHLRKITLFIAETTHLPISTEPLAQSDQQTVGLQESTSGPLAPALSGRISIKEKDFQKLTINQIFVEYGKGRWIVSWNGSADLVWSCRGNGGLRPQVVDSVMNLKAESSEELDCSVGIPKSIGLKIKGREGLLTLQRPESSVMAELGTGVVEFQESSNHKYKFQLQVDVGLIGSLVSSQEPRAIPIYIFVKDGKIVGLNR